MPKKFDFQKIILSLKEGSITLQPVSLDSGGFMLCRSGSATILINSSQYKIKKQDICVAFPYSTIQIISCSEDFEGLAIGVGIDFLINAPLDNKILHYVNISENSCMSLAGSEYAKIISLIDMFIDDNDDEIHPYSGNINENISQIILFEIAALYFKRAPIIAQKRSRSEVIFDQFMFLVSKDCIKHRKLDHYATLLQVTPTHLSKVIKKVSGIGATVWINDFVISNIKEQLKFADKTIYQISDMFNFPNSSFFSQYFKKHTGITPKRFMSQ